MFLTSLFKKLTSPITSQLSQMEFRLLREIEQTRILAAQSLIQNLKKSGVFEILLMQSLRCFPNGARTVSYNI